MSRKYVAVLALAAAAVLIGGSMLRPPGRPKAGTPGGHGQPSQPAPVATASPASNRGQMRQMSEFISDRAAGAATHMVWLADSGTSGVVWPDGSVVSAPRSSGLFEARTDRVTAAPVILADAERFSQAGWIVAVARSADGQSISASGLLGGVADVRCGSEPLRRLVFNTPLDSTFAGAGVFDLSGDLLGVVARCNDTWTALTWQSVQKALEKQSGPEEEVWRKLGVRVRETDAAGRSVMRLPRSGGLFVSEVRRGSRAYQIGLRPGDLVTRLGDKTVENVSDLSSDAETLTLLRVGKSLTLDAHPPFALEPLAGGPVLTAVESGTRLFEAGLRAGDRIVRINGIEDPGPTDLNRLFASEKPAWLVYERENRRVWTMLR